MASPATKVAADRDQMNVVIVGHVVVLTAFWIETDYSPPVWLQLAVYLPFTSIASLILLQPVKGAVVGMQWALRMHGFSENSGPTSSN